jgi:hypothetical protein
VYALQAPKSEGRELIATERFIEILAAADTSDDDDVALRAAIVAALREYAADLNVFTGREARRLCNPSESGR